MTSLRLNSMSAICFGITSHPSHPTFLKTDNIYPSRVSTRRDVVRSTWVYVGIFTHTYGGTVYVKYKLFMLSYYQKERWKSYFRKCFGASLHFQLQGMTSASPTAAVATTAATLPTLPDFMGGCRGRRGSGGSGDQTARCHTHHHHHKTPNHHGGTHT
jgi:hypothetical protein